MAGMKSSPMLAEILLLCEHEWGLLEEFDLLPTFPLANVMGVFSSGPRLSLLGL
jgi:hypothetical protein